MSDQQHTWRPTIIDGVPRVLKDGKPIGRTFADWQEAVSFADAKASGQSTTWPDDPAYRSEHGL